VNSLVEKPRERKRVVWNCFMVVLSLMDTGDVVGAWALGESCLMRLTPGCSEAGKF